MRKRRLRPTSEILDSAKRRLAKTLEQVSDAAGMPRAEWTDDRKKFYADLNSTPKEKPAYLDILKNVFPRMLDQEANKRAPIAVSINVASLSRDDWQRARDALASKDEKDRREFIDVTPNEAPKLPEPQPEVIDAPLVEKRK
jgi:hypothetical protein